MEEIKIRLDKFLKETRIINRRVVAKEVIESGNVLINNKVAKPSTNIKDDDLIEIFIKGTTLKIKTHIEVKGKKVVASATLVERKVEKIPEC